jgi:DNA gyrase subunit A
MRILDVPASSGYGDPVGKFFRVADGVKVVGLVTTDERFTPAEEPPANGEPAGPYLLVVTAYGQVLRTPLAPFRTASTKLGRRYVRLADGDRVVLACVVTDEPSLFLVSASGHVLHFALEEVNILAGVGKGVIGIKLAEGDVCLGGAVMSKARPALVVETSDAKTMEFTRRQELVSRGSRGFAAVKRRSFVRVVPPPIQLTDWEAVDGKDEKDDGQKTLFD